MLRFQTFEHHYVNSLDISSYVRMFINLIFSDNTLFTKRNDHLHYLTTQVTGSNEAMDYVFNHHMIPVIDHQNEKEIRKLLLTMLDNMIKLTNEKNNNQYAKSFTYEEMENIQNQQPINYNNQNINYNQQLQPQQPTTKQLQQPTTNQLQQPKHQLQKPIKFNNYNNQQPTTNQLQQPINYNNYNNFNQQPINYNNYNNFNNQQLQQPTTKQLQQLQPTTNQLQQNPQQNINNNFNNYNQQPNINNNFNNYNQLQQLQQLQPTTNQLQQQQPIKLEEQIKRNMVKNDNNYIQEKPNNLNFNKIKQQNNKNPNNSK
jgi:hypothetical protein